MATMWKNNPKAFSTSPRPFQDTQKFLNGILVTIGHFSVPEEADKWGNFNVSLHLRKADPFAEGLETGRDGHLKPVKLTKTLLKDLIGICLGVSEEKAQRAMANAGVDGDVWQRNFENRDVVLYAVDMEITDQDESAKMGTKVTKTVKTLRARLPHESELAAYKSEAQPEAKPEAKHDDSRGVIEPPKTEKEWFEALYQDPEFGALAKKYAPMGNPPQGIPWKLAKMKLSPVILKIKNAGDKKLDEVKPDVGTYLEPHTLEEAAKILGVTVSELMALDTTIRDLRIMLADAAGDVNF